MLIVRPQKKYWKNFNFPKTNYNLRERPKDIKIKGATINKLTLIKLFGRLHYLACHAPKAIQNKWTSTYNKFRLKHLPYKTYPRWCNEYTPQEWI
jgi:hypothetical protein